MVKIIKQQKVHHLTSSYVRKDSIEFHIVHAIIQVIKQNKHKVHGFRKYHEFHNFPDSRVFHQIIRVSEIHPIFGIFMK